MQNEKAFLKIRSSPLSEEAKEAQAALRAQIQNELQNKKQCNYQPHECTQLSLNGYDYCFRHILQDKCAPFKQCAYVYPVTSKRCYMPAPKTDKKEPIYCNEHALRNHLHKAKRNARYPPPKSTENLLYSLSHHLKKSRTRSTSSCTQYSDEGRSTPDEGEAKVTKSVDPFIDIDAAAITSSSSTILDVCSESESDVEAATYSSVWHDSHAESSDEESVDSEQEDVLKHANVYTAEEITSITRDKLIRLQALYIDQFRHLNYLLRERRRKYLHSLKREKESFCSINDQVRDNPKELRLYKKLKAYNNYHRLHGVEAVCRKKELEQRLQKTEGIHHRPPAYIKCSFTEGGVRCKERALPVARHCRKHILQDSNQVLFRACGKVNGDIACSTPIEAIFDGSTCNLHMDIPPLRSYAQIRDSESDFDDVEESKQHSACSSLTEKPVNFEKDEKYLSSIKEEDSRTFLVTDIPAVQMEKQIKMERNTSENSTKEREDMTFDASFDSNSNSLKKEDVIE
ncbi:KAT8 regulatory NSL complex subunit 2 isoform X2 [Agrilus planipennis]|uniref:KAT8 regulatory NSL complex subunit 2 n=1 Tax=Agrilus planipennis TaxID=224129 RepID=A0A7F5R0E8_AGRPL|nr:KAT8 regulatory NSL complex subunit 2 isoform X2 [Agrilus planipennis]